MPIKKDKIRSGIFTAVRLSCDLSDSTPKELSEAIKKNVKGISLESMLNDLEKRARQILIDAGYMFPSGKWASVNCDRMIDREKDAESVIIRIKEVRDQVAAGNAEWAAFNAILMANAAMRAEIRPIEGHVFRGVKVLNGAKRAGETTSDSIHEKREPIWEAWQEEAERIWEKYPGYSKQTVAHLIEHKFLNTQYKGPFNTIRQKIIKP